MIIKEYNLSPTSSFVFPQAIHQIVLNEGELINIDEVINKNEILSKIYIGAGKESSELVFDFGKKVTGFIFIDLISSSGDVIQYSFGPTQDSLFWNGEMVLHGNNMLCIDEQFVALRYLKIKLVSNSVIPADSWVELKGIGIKFSAFPVIYKGSFLSDSEKLNKIWYAGAYTTQLCIQREKYAIPYSYKLPEENQKFIQNWKSKYSEYVILDGPRRDREVWIGDVRPVALNIYYAFGANEVIKSTIDLICQLQDNGGLVPGSCSSRQEYIEYNFWFIIILWEYYFFTGEIDLLKSVYPIYKSVIDWIVYNADDNGFLNVEKTWMWTLKINKKAVEAHCVLHEALECAEKIENALGDNQNIHTYRKLAEKIKNTINSYYWSEEKGVYFEKFEDDNSKTVIPQDANVLAIVFNVADVSKRSRILKYLKDNMWTQFGSVNLDKSIEGTDHIWAHNRQIWPFMNAYEVQANFIAGNTEEAFELIERCWGNMVDQGSSTFWEMVDANDGSFTIKPFAVGHKLDSINSACHSWSAWVSYLLQAYVLGIRSVKVGCEEVVVEPNPGKLEYIKGAVPVPQGLINAQYEFGNNVIKITVSAPENIKIKLNLKEEVIRGRDVFFNGVQTYKKGKQIQ